jgi:hypothetical protein
MGWNLFLSLEVLREGLIKKFLRCSIKQRNSFFIPLSFTFYRWKPGFGLGFIEQNKNKKELLVLSYILCSLLLFPN